MKKNAIITKRATAFSENKRFSNNNGAAAIREWLVSGGEGGRQKDLKRRGRERERMRSERLNGENRVDGERERDGAEE